MIEILLAVLVLLSIYLLDEERMGQVGAWFQDFIDYLERQQQQG